MELEEIKNLLNDPKMKALVEDEILKAVEDRKIALDAEKEALVEEQKKIKKELFLFKKTILAKSKLAEQKIKTIYESKLEESISKISKDVFNFINTSIKTLTESIAEENRANSESEKICEAFSKAIKVMAPFLNVKELAESNSSVIDGYKKRINSLSKEVTELRGKVLSDDVNSLVVKECAGYPFEHKVVVTNVLKEAAPKTLTEAKEIITHVKEKLREKVEKPVETVTESLSFTEYDLKTNTEAIKKNLLTIVEDMKQTSEKLTEKVKKQAPVADPWDIM